MVADADLQTLATSNEHFHAHHESFEMIERRRMRSVLEDLRKCCQSELALRSFEKFEDKLLMLKSGTPGETMKAASVITTTARAPEIPNTISKLRHPWLFGSTSNAAGVESRVTSVSKTISSNKAPSEAQKPNGLAKSKTTGNLAEYQAVEGKQHIGGFVASSSHKFQHSRQPSNLSIQAQMNAKALREREERATKRAEETKRRVNSTGLQCAGGPPVAHKIVRRSEKADCRSGSQKMEYSGVREKRTVNYSENRKTSVVDAQLHTQGKERVLRMERQTSEPRELQRRTNRQSSGELLKTMVTGGLKGVRRMGRSLTGRSEMEDFDQPFRSDLYNKRGTSRSNEVGAAF